MQKRSYVVLGVLVVAVLAAVAVLIGVRPWSHKPSAEAGIATSPSPQVADSFRSVTGYQDEVAAPTRIRIPALHVDSKLVDLGLNPDGTVEVPKSTTVAGWYDKGVKPGAAGPAVILGHVDSKVEPGIFIKLSQVKAGTLVRVDRADGSFAMFRITGVQKVPKVKFPTDLVYAPTLDPTLRLVTCGGDFDRHKGSYLDNVIAFADLV
jgi:sortase (surface protein transpeptidase)